MAVNKNTIKLPLDNVRRERIRAALLRWFDDIEDRKSGAKVATLSDKTLVKWAKEEFSEDDSFYEDDDGNLID